MCGLKLPWDSFYRIPGQLFFSFSVVFFKPVFGIWKDHREHKLDFFQARFWSLKGLFGDHLAVGGLFQAHFWSLKGLLGDHLAVGGLFQAHFWSLERLLGDHLAMSGLFRTHFVTRKSPAKRPYISRWSLWRLWKDHKIWRMPYFFCSFRLRRPGGQTGGGDLRQITATHMEEAGRGCLPKNPLCLSGGKGEERKNV